MGEAWIDVENGDVQAQSHGLARQPDGRYTLASPSRDGSVGIDLLAARSPQGEDHEAGIEAASLVMHTLSCECDTPAGVQDCPYNGISEWEQRAVRSIVSAYLARVSPSRDGTVAVEDVGRVAQERR